MTVGSRDKTRVINVSVSRRNEEVLDLVEEFTDGKGMSRFDSIRCSICLSECSISSLRQREVCNGINKSFTLCGEVDQ